MNITKNQKKYAVVVALVVAIIIIILARPKEEIETQLMFCLEPNMAYAHLLVGDSVELNLEYYFEREGIDITHIYTEEELEEAIIAEDVVIVSEDSEVVMVDGSTITAQNTGETNVIIKSSVADTEIDVFVNVVDYASSIVVSEDWEVGLNQVGQVMPIMAQPAHTLGDILIVVENEDIALVDKNGVVTPVSVGETKVTFTLIDKESRILDRKTTNLIITE